MLNATRYVFVGQGALTRKSKRVVRVTVWRCLAQLSVCQSAGFCGIHNVMYKLSDQASSSRFVPVGLPVPPATVA